ncbi:tryptophan 2,3-dioxygenase family protein [Streptomyces olivaceus]|uniref:tryptophan 2,3-dioxygenase family protein n=1 Tax=Streptomyces olivaceus TaxID=47716 RepID=UPI001CCB8BEC|nr:tryptophan 2,3-dioxygenase family protein [Streptomyces olivaceus]MBZ6141852.1 FAD-dependent monooxygenase [Streptomyces olivaceus]MBZ6165918.1 FAD-dependent monooxygenase [Streptomyces olivaceus]
MTSPNYATYLHLPELLDLQRPLTPVDQQDLSDSERLFIVVHQASETLLSQVLVDLRHIASGQCGRRCHDRRAQRATRLVGALEGQLKLLHHTLPREDFLLFRHRFGTASGVQSKQFHELFARVRKLTKHGDEDGPAADPELLTALDEAVRRWRHTHIELVAHMLGDRPGSAETSGLRWLAARLDGTSDTTSYTTSYGSSDTASDTASSNAEPSAAEPSAAEQQGACPVAGAGRSTGQQAAGREAEGLRSPQPPTAERQPVTAPQRAAAAGGLGHVVVVGGSVAGLLTAHVLAGHAERVTVLERDQYEDTPGPRAGVPQSRHTHVLLTSGMNALEELLPGLLPALEDAGAPRLAVPGDLGVWQAGQWISRRNPSRPIMTPSRPLLEHHVRRRVLDDPRVHVRTGVEVTGLLGRPGHITGVAVRTRGGDHPARQEIEANLVVDASGRASRTPAWLADLGAPAPAEELVETGRAYATCVFHADHPPEDLDGFYIVPDAGQPLGAIVLPVEGDRWMVTLSGPRGEAPPGDAEGFVEFAGRLPHSAPHKWLRSARPAGRPAGYRHTANRRRRYDRQGQHHTGLLVVGDAACALNPVYGQGLSVAALNAVALRETLAGKRAVPSRTLQRAVFRSARRAWDVATGADSPMPGVTGNAVRSGPAARLLTRYLDRVRAHVPHDPVVCGTQRDVLFLLAPPRTLVTSPRVLRRALLSPAGPARSAPPTP